MNKLTIYEATMQLCQAVIDLKTNDNIDEEVRELLLNKVQDEMESLTAVIDNYNHFNEYTYEDDDEYKYWNE